MNRTAKGAGGRSQGDATSRLLTLLSACTQRRTHATDTCSLIDGICDTLVELWLRTEGSMRRYLSIRKSRVSRCDLQVREMVLTPTGVDLAEPEGPLAG